MSSLYSALLNCDFVFLTCCFARNVRALNLDVHAGGLMCLLFSAGYGWMLCCQWYWTERWELKRSVYSCWKMSSSVISQLSTSGWTSLFTLFFLSPSHYRHAPSPIPSTSPPPPHTHHKCINIHGIVILCSLCPSRSTSDSHRFAWQLLSVIASGENMDLRRYLSRVMEHWSKAKKLTPTLVKALCSHTEDEDHLQVRQYKLKHYYLFVAIVQEVCW